MDIQLIHIKKCFQGQKVLEDINISFAEGRINGIMGPSGSGKTTLLYLLMGLMRPDSGKIHGMEGKKISTVFQEDRLVEHWDAVKNVLLVCKNTVKDDVVKEHFRKVGLNDYEGKPVKKLSGGMKRRVAIVRAMLAEADIVLMDEPFQGLNDELKYQVIEYVKEETKGKTVILVTHDKEEIERLDAKLIDLK